MDFTVCFLPYWQKFMIADSMSFKLGNIAISVNICFKKIFLKTIIGKLLPKYLMGAKQTKLFVDRNLNKRQKVVSELNE